MYLICLILIYYVKRRCRNLSFGQCKDSKDIPKLYVLDNFSYVKICQVAENQEYKKSFWTTLLNGGCPKRITSCLSVLSCRCVWKRALVEVFLCSIFVDACSRVPHLWQCRIQNTWVHGILLRTPSP